MKEYNTICNLDAGRHFVGVCETIEHTVRASLPQSALPTAPSSEGALDKNRLINNE